jgi:hypothetical protein
MKLACSLHSALAKTYLFVSNPHAFDRLNSKLDWWRFNLCSMDWRTGSEKMWKDLKRTCQAAFENCESIVLSSCLSNFSLLETRWMMQRMFSQKSIETYRDSIEIWWPSGDHIRKLHSRLSRTRAHQSSPEVLHTANVTLARWMREKTSSTFLADFAFELPFCNLCIESEMQIGGFCSSDKWRDMNGIEGI